MDAGIHRADKSIWGYVMPFGLYDFYQRLNPGYRMSAKELGVPNEVPPPDDMESPQTPQQKLMELWSKGETDTDKSVMTTAISPDEYADIVTRRNLDPSIQNQRQNVQGLKTILAKYLEQPQQVNLAPLMRMGDFLTRDRYNLAERYGKGPLSAEERAKLVSNLQTNIVNAQHLLNKEETDFLRSQLRNMETFGTTVTGKKWTAPPPKPTYGADFKNLPEDTQIQIKNMSTATANKKTILNQIKSDLEKYRNAKTTDDKVVYGQNMLKVLNSTEGKDAVGAEEAARLAAYLEFQKGNLFQPGPFMGRDLEAFERQITSTVTSLKNAITENEKEIERLKGSGKKTDSRSSKRKSMGLE